MNEQIRSLSDTEVDGVAGGLQSPSGSKGLVVMPDPGFVIDATAPGPGPSFLFEDGDFFGELGVHRISWSVPDGAPYALA